MVVVYYTCVPYLECAIEIINALKNKVQLHVLIEISPETMKGPITEVKELREGPVLRPLEALLESREVDLLRSYFEGTESAQFVVHTHKRTFSLATFLTCRRVSEFCKRINPDLIHFDSVSPRSMGMLPYLYRRMRKKLVISMHDPVPHSGEHDWRGSLMRSSYAKIAGTYLFYSKFAKEQFESAYPDIEVPRRLITMSAYSFYRNYIHQPVELKREYILFFGRISPYKGLETFLEAIPTVLERFPKQKFVIAGRRGYDPDLSVLAAYPENIQFIDRYIPNEEMVRIISSAQFIVCPYKDATQSGVLMTSFACNTPAIASKVGAFAQYIREGWNGSLVEVNNSEALSNKIIDWMQKESFKTYIQNMSQLENYNNWLDNQTVILQSYHALISGHADAQEVSRSLVETK